MEYYIMKFYEDAKTKNSNVEQGFNRFKPQIRKWLVVIMVMLVVAGIGIITSLFLSNNVLLLIMAILEICSFTAIIVIDSVDQKKHLEKYSESQKDKIGILEQVLINEFNIKKRNKVEELIKIYQCYVDKRDVEEKSRNKLILTISSVIGSIISISFVNMDNIGLTFSDWFAFAVVLFIIMALVSGIIYVLKFFESLKRKYEIMIKDLRELLLIKY